MDVKIILSTQIIGLLIKTTTSQYYGNPYQQSYQQPYQQQSYAQPSYAQQSYAQPSYAQQSYQQQSYLPQQMQQAMQTPIQVHVPQSQPQPTRREHDPPNLRAKFDDYSTDYDEDSDMRGYARKNNRDSEVEELENTGNRDVGNSPMMPLNGNMSPQMAVQPNLVLVPYPYALIVPTTNPPIITTPNPTTPKPLPPQTAPEPAPATPAPPAPNRRLHYDEPGIRYRARRTKPTWVPKYGIVPIPDKLAEKLMSQLRDVKGLQARRSVNMENKNNYYNALAAQLSSMV